VQKRLDDKNVWVKGHARRHIDLLEKGEKLPAACACPVQMWQFGRTPFSGTPTSPF
jgi:hypothetical protein